MVILIRVDWITNNIVPDDEIFYMVTESKLSEHYDGRNSKIDFQLSTKKMKMFCSIMNRTVVTSWMKTVNWKVLIGLYYSLSIIISESINDEDFFEMIGMPTRNNIGFDSFQEAITTRSKSRLIRCPEMVGPIDGKYYCYGVEHGYCDRRSGTCFCNKGYAGLSCNACDPYHFLEGGLCIEKKSCPNACSNSGHCDIKTGRCTCNVNREGDDCSRSLCKMFHEYCTYCDDYGCLGCFEGYAAVPDLPMGEQCISCHARFDPRCSSCNATACQECQDLLLLSIHRSGPRSYDPELPFDEMKREFGISIPFGSQLPDAFDNAEHYFLAPSNMIPLKSYAVSCDQGLSGDASFDCRFFNISNVMCGHFGTISWTQSHYDVLEGNGYVRVQIERSGGGMGQVNVSYAVEHITTDDSDVSSTAYYTDSRTITFSKHEVMKSFLITIHDDATREVNESFALYLYDPTDPARLGSQNRAIVTIIDDDKGVSVHSELKAQKVDSILTVQIYDNQKENRANMLCVYFLIRDMYGVVRKRKGKLHREVNGTLIWFTNDSNTFIDRTAIVHDLQPNGLLGDYYDTEYSFSEADSLKQRVDRSINFTAFENGITHVRWEGFLRNTRSELKIFSILAYKSRLWIDGFLIIDEWNHFNNDTDAAFGVFYLNADELYTISVEVEVGAHDPVKLLWGSRSSTLKVIEKGYLHFKAKSTSVVF